MLPRHIRIRGHQGKSQSPKPSNLLTKWKDIVLWSLPIPTYLQTDSISAIEQGFEFNGTKALSGKMKHLRRKTSCTTHEPHNLSPSYHLTGTRQVCESKAPRLVRVISSMAPRLVSVTSSMAPRQVQLEFEVMYCVAPRNQRTTHTACITVNKTSQSGLLVSLDAGGS